MQDPGGARSRIKPKPSQDQHSKFFCYETCGGRTLSNRFIQTHFIKLRMRSKTKRVFSGQVYGMRMALAENIRMRGITRYANSTNSTGTAMLSSSYEIYQIGRLIF